MTDFLKYSEAHQLRESLIEDLRGQAFDVADKCA